MRKTNKTGPLITKMKAVGAVKLVAGGGRMQLVSKWSWSASWGQDPSSSKEMKEGVIIFPPVSLEIINIILSLVVGL